MLGIYYYFSFFFFDAAHKINFTKLEWKSVEFLYEK